MICFALSENYFLSFFILLVSGVFDNVSVVIRSTILQTQTPDEMRGRVAAVNSIFVGSSNELGAFESGFVAAWIGTVPCVFFGGLATLGIVGLGAIGSMVADMALAMGMKVVGFDPALSIDAAWR